MTDNELNFWIQDSIVFLIHFMCIDSVKKCIFTPQARDFLDIKKIKRAIRLYNCSAQFLSITFLLLSGNKAGELWDL